MNEFQPILRRLTLLPLALLLGGQIAVAAAQQDDMPAVDTSHPASPTAAEPAVPTSAKPAAADNGKGDSGTTIVGNGDESPIGLYITPWRDAYAEKGIDRPARLLQEKALPIDRVVFKRQVQYYDALSTALKSKGVVTPEQN
ncbi:hypothetical protein [Solimonas marina]|uniref:Uncharacterized protein n=1 Tax=Solimonas marina TaxID=2714601 RepID=A0A969WC16_9GAMM|nr:hypothetical protein [Solimonas marina]NKF23774.1 hypothetical protein [Solimonas marina]